MHAAQSGAFGGLRKVDVLCAEERSSAYLDHDSEKNIYGSFYHVREPKTRKLPMTVPEFVGCLTSWSSKKLLLKVRLNPVALDVILVRLMRASENGHWRKPAHCP